MNETAKEPIVTRLRWAADGAKGMNTTYLDTSDLLEAIDTIEILLNLINDMDRAILNVKKVAQPEFERGHAYIEMELARQKAHNAVWKR